ncbi:BREX-2 system adenine-specific DNA-methyltransferase PglX [Actinomadura miaoliensis]|uniref:site-specific DNA-methyltransferase (adenine-specific) n=1 Tax=Actinomadura miaoliensis TaxID=430685 RepID=A0ABP7W536_9ACTN
MIDRKALLADLKKQVTALEGHLRERAAEDEAIHARLHGEWQKAREASRTAATYESWRDERVTQAAVAWVLGTVFLRFCEDNGLIEQPFLAGPGDRLTLAVERQADHIRRNPHDTDRHWILEGFKEMSRSPVAAGLFDRAHNPMWQIEIPHHAAKDLLGFWRQRDEQGELVHDFTDPEWDTRFLGDLYQDLSEHAKKTYALLQTPEFVEEFILDYTLEPAIEDFGLHGLRLIDPTCGSGHFLLGAFHRILNKWRDAEPGTAATDIWTLIRRTILSVHGVDKNPFAVNIAKFRLLVASMKQGHIKFLAHVPDFPIIVATGDSLLHGRGALGVQLALEDEAIGQLKAHTYQTEDIYEFIALEDDPEPGAIDLLGAGSYHVVVGNPPYITVKDKLESITYRSGYKSCVGAYALSVPFVERFFQLARLGDRQTKRGGLVGQITANSFMKREFGKKLIEEYLPKVDLTRIIDSSGAYIPGHGTPTVILIGRRQWAREEVPVRVVMSTAGEPSPPKDPAKGHVWRAIVDQIERPGSDSRWVSVVDIPRERLRAHPWSLTGGGAAQLKETIESRSAEKLGSIAEIGASAVTRENEAFIVGEGPLRRHGVEEVFRRPLLDGEYLRDWSFNEDVVALWPYNSGTLEPVNHKTIDKFLWPWRTQLKIRVAFGKSQLERGLPWTAYSMFFANRFGGFSIAFSFVQTHNQFVLDRQDRVFNRTAPVIKLPNGTEDDYLGLLGVLNSSIGCFWLKQVCHDKGSQGINEGFKSQSWERFYEFTATKLQEFPLPRQLPLSRGQDLEVMARQLSDVEVTNALMLVKPTADFLLQLQKRWLSTRGRMIAEQEELDWEVYSLYGLLDEGLTAPSEAVPELKLGERAFEIVLARKMERGEVQTEWFNRHGSTPITEIPEHWPEEYKRVVEKRIEVIENRRDIALIERPECKRRWATEPWEKKEKAALRNWLLDRCEDRRLWFEDDENGVEQPRVMTVNELADRLRRDEDFVSVARLYADDDDVELDKVIEEITKDEQVPHLAALRYKESGLRKRAQWEDVWEQQREEDRTGKRLDIPVPPKYTSADFLRPSYWRNRGKLDVPKERFVSYPESSTDADPSLLLGWAGWDHREQAQALVRLIEERATKDGWDAARLTPLLAGLAEVLPWVKQWHGDVDPAFGQSPADAFTAYLEAKQIDYGISDDDLKKWRPAKKARRGGRPKRES